MTGANFYFFKDSFLILYISECFACICICVSCAYLVPIEEGVRSLGTRVIGGFDLSYGF